jgi:pyruvate dehydrogenase E2 component (dihydrolipoamide acetyltransferase)
VKHFCRADAIDDPQAGRLLPCFEHADRKSLREISTEARDLAGRARERRLAPEEYTGGTFSISNLGMLDIDEFTAVINPPEAGILAVGRIVPKPVAHDGAVAVRRRMRLTKSFKEYTADAVKHEMSNYKPAVFLDTGEDLEEFELTLEGVEVRR